MSEGPTPRRAPWSPGREAQLRRASLALGTVLGLLSRWSEALFVAGPLLVACSRWRPAGGRGHVMWGATLAAGLAVPWYVAYVVAHVPPEGVLVGLGAAPMEPRGPLQPLRLATVLLDQQAHGPLRLVLLAVVLCIAVRLARRPGTPEEARERRSVLALVSEVALPYATLTLLRSPEGDALLAAMPALAGLSAWTLAAIPWAPARAAATVLVVGYGLAVVHVGLASEETRMRVRQALRPWPTLQHAVANDTSEMKRDRRGAEWRAVEVVEAVGAAQGPLTPRLELLLLREHSGLNAETLNWVARTRGLPFSRAPSGASPCRPTDSIDHVLVRADGRGEDEEAELSAPITSRRDEFLPVGLFETPAGWYA